MKNPPLYMPKIMVHPSYRKSIPRTFEAAGTPRQDPNSHIDTSGIAVGGTRGTADVFPPVTVSSKDAEDKHRAMGYRFQDEPPGAVGYSEFPMWVVKDGAPDLLVHDSDELADAEAKGYRPPGQPNPQAFERENASPYVAGHVTQEFPKMVDGQLVDPEDYDGPIQYPKWVGDKLVQSAAEERELLGSAAMPDRLALAQAARDRATAAAAAALKAQQDAEAELAALLGDDIPAADAPAAELAPEPPAALIQQRKPSRPRSTA